MDNPAISPAHSATVSASAGTGKTWLLVTRLIRLLLIGERPDGILAVTFTRKAAAEMLTRLTDRLRDMASADEIRLSKLLAEIEAPDDATTRQHARALYENLLTAPSGIRTTTFHAFCQDVLRRFPLEAGIPPGFELLESTAEFQQASWDALCNDASLEPDGNVARALEQLMESCNGMENARTSLNSFLAHRSDWWAYTESHPEPLDFALEELAQQLDTDLEADPCLDFFTPSMDAMLQDFVHLLDKHNTIKNTQAITALGIARDATELSENRFQHLCTAFLTQKGEPLARKESKAQAKSMGDDGQARFLEIHVLVCQAIARTRDALNALQTLTRTRAWYITGLNLLSHFQRLKSEQRYLDFADLEWQAYRLLNHSQNVHWIQYKLDQRLDHLLVDEFQDTNPTQWRLILPLLQELAAGESERQRSVFLVGDSKQSIYRFRRADPELFDAAQTWLQEHLHSVSQPLDTSWRSAPAIMDAVNCLFGSGPLQQQLQNFIPHSTHHQSLWGRVEVLPLASSTIEQETPVEEASDSGSYRFRNPLQAPRHMAVDDRHFQEGRQIAQRIATLMNDKTPIGFAQEARQCRYRDIMILLRNRTHVADYEQALREAGIPYASANRGTLLESREAQDLVNLLELLVSPFNNLALANLLRSPLFDCPQEILTALARSSDGHWIHRLDSLVQDPVVDHSVTRAHRLLTQWRGLAGILPVHDLLDRIFADANVLNRYQAAYPSHLQHRVVANLTRFVELALEVDSGRYPTIGHFVARLQNLRQQDQDAPDEGTPTQTDDRVRILTIHASKGLEAPVVFIADCTHARKDRNAYKAMVDWPAQADQPQSFLLTGKKDQLDVFSRAITERNARADAREDANLFYVAITRARQFLFLSGVEPNRGRELGWYGIAIEQIQGSEQNTPVDGDVLLSSGSRPALLPVETDSIQEPVSVDERLSLPVIDATVERIISPSQELDSTPATSRQSSSHPLDSDHQTRGIAIHRMLELLCNGIEMDSVLSRITSEFGLAQGTAEISVWLAEAQTTYTHSELKEIFDPGQTARTYNEVPIQYQLGGHTVFGIIDRLLIYPEQILVVDYKTHTFENEPKADADTIAQIAELKARYQSQLSYYAQGVSQLWKDKPVRAGLLLTNVQRFVEIDLGG